ncbi:B3 domain-containing protein Os05g0481400 [Telopea speciosissima]|uniref:B3 domain-containing protein Os05g0481400 n=1 Tax=Telopea speciosissima TaxID=54955 RepID=UPI001CC755F9|nr:B3 domain-containing protein Os05g0481400 [Telopea speciosissima]
MAKTSTRSQEINTYEESRKRRLQDNQKRFEDLGILKISKSLSEVTNSVKKSPQHRAKPKPNRSIDMLELRRSSRARNLVPSYSDAPDIGLPTPRKRSKPSSWKSYLGRPANEVKFASNEERDCAFRNAEMLQSNMGSKNPCFVKSMVRSHVYSCFWLGLPSKFCKDHLPSKDVNMILEDEDGSEYDAIYIGSRQGLSGGWRGFALDHKLDDGDALVFELSEPTRFKIYIVRASILRQ